jgi:hypothetical protein
MLPEIKKGLARMDQMIERSKKMGTWTKPRERLIKSLRRKLLQCGRLMEREQAIRDFNAGRISKTELRKHVPRAWLP